MDSSTVRKSTLLAVFTLLSVVWVFFTIKGDDEFLGNVFTNIYYVVALLGGIFGIVTSRKWGGFKSYLGKSLGFLSAGLLFTVFGQMINSYFVLVSKLDELPYPSVAEIGFFGAVVLYVIGAYYLGKTVGISSFLSQKGYAKKLVIFSVPVLMFVATIGLYLMNYSSDGSTLPQMILDFAYPIGQGIFAAIALTVLFRSRDLYGGKLRMAVIVLLMSLVVQYAADLNFLFQNLNETWKNGGYGDYMYLLAYFLTAYGVQMFVLPKVVVASEGDAQ